MTLSGAHSLEQAGLLLKRKDDRTMTTPAPDTKPADSGAPYRAARAPAAPGQTTRRRAMLWCALLGGVGAHRFYLGQKGFGLLYLCFCWTFVPLIASWIDLAIMAAQDDEDFAEEQRETPLLQPLGYDGALRGKHQSLAHKDRSA